MTKILRGATNVASGIMDGDGDGDDAEQRARRAKKERWRLGADLPVPAARRYKLGSFAVQAFAG